MVFTNKKYSKSNWDLSKLLPIKSNLKLIVAESLKNKEQLSIQLGWRATMKHILSLFLLLLVSCVGNPEEIVAPTVVMRRYEPISVTVEDSERVQSICQALLNKEDLLAMHVSNGTGFTFSYSEKGCRDQNLSTPKLIKTRIDRSDSNFYFLPVNGYAFSFTEVETTNRGVLAEICQRTSDLVNPIQTSRSGALWFTTFTSNKHCQSDATGICIHLQKGSIVDELNYQIHTEEWIKFKITNNNRGFFTERKLISHVGCGVGQVTEKRASLK